MAIQNKMDDAKDIINLLFAKKKNKKEKDTNGESTERVNVMLAGKTGVGKSTLVNAVFGEEFAETGVGAPITQNLDLYEKDGIPISIYDVKGLELDPAVQKSIRSEMKKLIKECLKTEDKNDDIHLLWYCIASAGVRIEQFELDFINELAKHIDVVVVITKSYDADETRQVISYIEHEKDHGSLPIKSIAPVLAADRTIDGNVVKEKFGLKELSDLSYELLPDAQKRAFAASQRTSGSLQKKAAYSAITLASAASAAAGAIPIPVADAAVLVPIQMTMFKCIANVYGVTFKEDDFTKIIAAVVPDIAVNVGRSAVVSLSKLIPGVGIAASAISGGVAASITVALGVAFDSALSNQINEIDFNDGVPEEFSNIMKDVFKEKFNYENINNPTT